MHTSKRSFTLWVLFVFSITTSLELLGQTLTTSCADPLPRGSTCSITYTAGYTLSISPSGPALLSSTPSGGNITNTYSWNVTPRTYLVSLLGEPDGGAGGGSGTVASITITVYNPVGQVSFTSGSTFVCQNVISSPYTASATNASDYNWSMTPAAAGSINPTTGAVTWNTANSTGATITVNAYGSTGDYTTASRTVTRQAMSAFSPTLNVPGEVCAGTQATISVSSPQGAATYAWYAEDNVTVISTASYITVSPQQSTWYRVRVTPSSSIDCLTNYNFVELTTQGTSFHVKPRATGMNISGPATRCITDASSTPYSVSWYSNSVDYTIWSIDTGGSISSSGVVTWNAGFSGQAVITATGYGCGGSTSEDTHTITVYSLPASQTLNGASAICSNQTGSIYLSGSQTGVTYTISPSGTPTSPTQWTVGPGTYTVYGNNGVCPITQVASKAISVDPPANFMVSGATDICSNQNFVLTASGGIASTLIWILQDKTIQFTNSINEPSVAGMTSITLQGNEVRCNTFRSQTIPVTVKQKVEGVTIGGSGTTLYRCVTDGSTTQLTVTSDNNSATGTPPYTWSIDQGGTISGTGLIHWTDGYYGNALITAIGYGCNGSSDTDYLYITVDKPVDIELSAPSSICINQTDNISVVSPKPGVTYTITPAATLNSLASWSVHPGSYTVKAKNAGCPEQSISKVIDVQAPAALNILGPTNLCEGDYIDLTVRNTQDASALSWLIMPDGILLDGTMYGDQDIPTIQSHMGITSIQVSGRERICHTQVTTSNPIVVNEALHSITLEDNIPFHCGTSAPITYSVDGKGVLTWTVDPPTAGTVDPSGSTIQWANSISSAVTITLQGTGCNGVKSQPIVVEVDPFPVVPASTNIQFCDFEQIVLTGGGGPDVITNNWYATDGTFLGSQLNLPLTVSREGIYNFKYVAIGENGCINPQQASLTVTVGRDAPCDDKLNWIESTSYAYKQEGSQNVRSEIAHAKAYFDLAGKPLQTQTKHYSSGQIFTAQAVHDQYDRVALVTMAAPIDQTDFKYKHWVAVDQLGGLYDFTDLGNPIGNEPGTIGWFYSSANTSSDAPKTTFPYSQTDFYEDGSGEARRSSAPGNDLRMGQGKETWSGTFPVFAELNDYLARRNSIGLTDHLNGSFAGGAVQSVARDQNGKFVISISDKSGKTLMSARAGTGTNALALMNNIIADASDAKRLVYFYLLEPTTVTIGASNGTYTVEDLMTNVSAQHFQDASNGNKWPAGFYRLIVNTGTVNLNYTNYVLDVSYQFYDDAGRLISSISPNGYVRWAQAGSDYNKIDKTTYRYNFQSWLLSMQEPDAGITNYVYRKDGKIRFSQNAEQKLTGKYSFTNYDLLGRPVESGEFQNASVSFKSMTDTDYTGSGMQTELEKLADAATITGTKNDWVKTFYDFADDQFDDETNINQQQENLVQDFVRGAVSYTQNANNKTWYSYDEMGRVTWFAQQPTGLTTGITKRAFVTRYEYDFLGNVLHTYTVMYVNGMPLNSTAFHHHYDYDKDNRLSIVQTSTDGTNKKLRAKYTYYLHGPLKRVELGDKIQGIDFVYNVQGWLTQINHPDNVQDPGGDGTGTGKTGFKEDVFGMVLDYYENTLANQFLSSLNPKYLKPELFHGLPLKDEEATVVASNTEQIINITTMDWAELARESMLKNKELLNTLTH